VRFGFVVTHLDAQCSVKSTFRRHADTEQRICEEYLALVERAQQLFAGLRDLPMFGKQWEPYFHRTFEIYTRLWKFQQQHRAVLENKDRYGLERWEIGEIASKIGQLYYHYYLRTSETHYLQESYVFYEAIRTRSYFKGVLKLKSGAVMVKKLRFFARFIVVCLLLTRHKIVEELVTELTELVKEYITTLKPTDSQEWQLILQEITLFLQADSPLLIKDGLDSVSLPRRVPWSFVFQVPQTSKLFLQSSILVGNHLHQVKFSELTLDMFRMMLSLEHELGTPGDSNSDKEREKRPNPKKYLLYRPTASQLLLFVASAMKELKENGVLLLYLSADGCKPLSPDKTEKSLEQNVSSDKFQLHRTQLYSLGGVRLNKGKKGNECESKVSTPVSHRFEPTATSTTTSSAPPSSTNKNANDNPSSSTSSADPVSPKECFYPQDLMPFTRRPMFIIVDSDNALAFLSMANIFGVPLMVLASPSAQPPEILEASQAGNLFTFFLHDPLTAFCFTVTRMVLTQQVYNQCTEILNNLLLQLQALVTTSPEMPPEITPFFSDEFLLLFILRFIFCHAVLYYHINFQSQPRLYLPDSSPRLPHSILFHPILYKSIEQLSAILGASDKFRNPEKSQSHFLGGTERQMK